jgi:hypothetical protein
VFADLFKIGRGKVTLSYVTENRLGGFRQFALSLTQSRHAYQSSSEACFACVETFHVIAVHVEFGFVPRSHRVSLPMFGVPLVHRTLKLVAKEDFAALDP